MNRMEEQKFPDLRARLSAVLGFVRQGSVVADVGTDHAHLPITLCLSGIASRVIASDVREGPVVHARENVRAYGVEDRVTVLMTDGLHGIEAYEPDDVLISGMGGELIVRILSEAPFLKKHGKRVVLQPQTHPELVRDFLRKEGFCIVGEAIAEDDGDRLYQIIAAEYDGLDREREDSPRAVLLDLIGAPGMGQDSALYEKNAQKTEGVYRRRAEGKMRAERPDAKKDDVSSEQMILRELEILLSELGRQTMETGEKV